MATIDQLQHSSLTGRINKIKSPAQALHTMLYGTHQTLPTETMEIGFLAGGREAAPYVKVNAEGILMTGTTEQLVTLKAPNIRIKRAFTPSELLYGRRPGSPIFISTENEMLSEVDEYLNREVARLADAITNAQEVQSAQSLTGTISYSNETGDVWQLTIPRDATLTLDPGAGNYWDTDDPGDAIYTIKQRMSELDGFQPDIAIMGALATAAFRANTFVKATTTLFNNAGVGRATYATFFQENGMIYCGNYNGIDFWGYPRTVLVNGSATDLIRSKYVEFIATGPAAERVEYFASIADMKALQGRTIQVERFSKAWEQEDPSVIFNLATSRPLVVPRQVNASASVQVVA